MGNRVSKGLLKKIQQTISYLNSFQETYPNHYLNKDKSLSDSDGFLQSLASELNLILDDFSKIFLNKNITLNEVEQFGREIKSLQIDSDNWSANELINITQPLNKELILLPNKFSNEMLAVARNTVEISKIVSNANEIKNAISNNPSEFIYQQILKDVISLHSDLIKENEERFLFINQCSLNFDHWLANHNDSIANIISRNNEALDNTNWLNTWLEYIRLKNRLYGQGFKNLIGALEGSNMESQDLQNIVTLVINYQLTTEIFASSPDLATFIGLEQTAIQQRFKEYDIQILKLQRKKIAFKASRSLPPIGISTGMVKNLTEVSLIRQELGKKTRHIPVRSLLKRASNAIQTLNPCFMMSPMSVAQYLEPGKLTFDLVIMDEASQIRPEDALGAIARGKTLVVVGDPKQLPTTNFFNKVLNDDFEEDQVALQVSDSILEAVMPMFNTRRLRWHYRSKHESLIAFSNHHFYDDDLVLFPSPFKSSPDFGIKLHRIPRGRFVNRRNVEEAQELVKSAADHLINHPDESLGIVAMNSEQRDEIEKQLDQLAKDNPVLLRAYEDNKSSQEPLFIKNLENVQGDERDVIYISMTYGPEQIGGRTMQRFGPINTNVGWRRLNVLFTRSKKRMNIFSSMTSGDVLISPTSSRGVKSLKAFLEYSDTGHLHNTKITGKAPDSDFELAVISILDKHGYECEPQLGVAGFFLDIAVRDPGKPGRFLMGIECDGATYHSAKSARDRDHLRQEILESLGWKIKRIWSTDWFKHPEAQIQPILNELEKLKTPISDAPQYTDVLDDSSENIISHFEIEPYQLIGIKDRLLSYDRDVIRVAFPETNENYRLLRTEMLNVLLELLPTSKVEFQEVVPAYLRIGTDANEAKFLDEVLNIIADYA